MASKHGVLACSHPQLWPGATLPLKEYSVVDEEGRARIDANGVVYGPKVLFGRYRCQRWARRNGYGVLAERTS